MNNDLISRRALLATLGKLYMAALRKTAHSVETIYELDRLAMLVKDAPAADAELVRHARWQFEARGKDGVTALPVCSGCGATPKYYVPKNDVGMQVPPYCHECGSKMAAEVKHEQ